MTEYSIEFTHQYLKDFPQKNRDHMLTGDYKGLRECHITPDWLLIYERKEVLKILTLVRTGSHSDLFK